MKKAFAYIAVAVLALSSCQSTVKTARTVDAVSNIRSITVADLKVADKRVTSTIDNVSSDLRRGGEKNVKQAVEQKALAENGGADVLVDPQFVVKKKRGLFGSKIKSITVSGRPAWYQNFRSLDDSIWNNPAYRQVVPVNPKGAAGNGFGRGAFMGAFAGKLQKTPVYREKSPAFRPRGWHGNVDLYLGGGSEDESEKTVDFTYTATANFGYQFSPYFYWGIGSGYMSLSVEDAKKTAQMIPVFHDVRFYMSRKAITPFLDVKLGTAFVVGDWLKDADKVKQAMMVSPSVGCCLGIFDVSAYFMHTQFKAKFKYQAGWGYGTQKVDFNFNTWGVKLGVRF